MSTVSTPIRRLVDANGLRMRIVEQGTGPLVLLCHGFPETSHAWRHQIAALAQGGYHAVAPDLRGYGGTDAPHDAGAYSLVDLVGDVVGLLDALRAPSAVIVGNDWGATLAWQAALLRPDRVRGVVAIGVPLMGRPPVPPTALFPRSDDALLYALYFQAPGVAERELARDVATTLRKILFAASGDAGPRRDGDNTPNPFGMVTRADGLLAPLPLPDRLPAWLGQADLDAFVAAFEGSGFAGALHYYRNLDRNWALQRAFVGRTVDVPALYMVGERDPGRTLAGSPEIVAGMKALAPRLRDTIVVQGAGHWVPQERPAEVNAALIAFMQSV